MQHKMQMKKTSDGMCKNNKRTFANPLNLL